MGKKVLTKSTHGNDQGRRKEKEKGEERQIWILIYNWRIDAVGLFFPSFSLFIYFKRTEKVSQSAWGGGCLGDMHGTKIRYTGITNSEFVVYASGQTGTNSQWRLTGEWNRKTVIIVPWNRKLYSLLSQFLTRICTKSVLSLTRYITMHLPFHFCSKSNAQLTTSTIGGQLFVDVMFVKYLWIFILLTYLDVPAQQIIYRRPNAWIFVTPYHSYLIARTFVDNKIL